MKSLKIKSFYKLIVVIFLTTLYCLFYICNYKVVYRDNVLGTITNIKNNNTYYTLTVKNVLVKYETENFKYKIGDQIKVKGEVVIPDKSRNFNLFNYQNYLLSNKIDHIINATNIKLIKKGNVFYSIKNMIIEKIDNYKSKDYLNTFILGKNEVDSDIKDTYRINGISHLFAISGMHITLLSTIILTVLNKIKKTKINYFITILLLIFYMFLTNFSPSVIRSTLMFIALTISKNFNLKLKTLDILIILLCSLLIYNPFYIYNVGFVYSFTISIFLVMFSNLINKQKNYLSKLFMTSFISFLASFPITIYNFFSINLLSVILNLFFVPLVSFILFPLSLITLFIDKLDSILFYLINYFEQASSFFAKFNFLTLTFSKPNIFIIIIYMVLVYIILKYKRGIISIVILLIIHYFSFSLNYEIYFIDVNQGDSILIRMPYNKGNVLVDTGGKLSFDGSYDNKIGKNTLLPFLKSLGIRKLDYLVLTHGDADHMMEAKYLINNIKVKNILLNSYSDNKLEEEVKKLKKVKNISKYTFRLNGVSFNFINGKYSNENDDSLILLTKINNVNILLMGDASIKNEKYLIDTYNLNNVDILKLGHHGSKTSSSYEFLKKVDPKYAIISVGLNNRFNHPSDSVIKNLNDLKIKYYMTSTSGMIKITLKKKFKIETCL